MRVEAAGLMEVRSMLLGWQASTLHTYHTKLMIIVDIVIVIIEIVAGWHNIC